MTLGDKIRKARCDKRLTQSEVTGDKITRNMLSAIESNKALPSLDTLIYLSDRLNLPVAYLLSDENNISAFRKNELIADIRSAFAQKRYNDCILMSEQIDEYDDELSYLLAYAHFELGISNAKLGSFLTGEKHLTIASKLAKETIYDTKKIECLIPLYMSFLKNVNFPLFDFNKEEFYASFVEDYDFEFYKYICNDTEYKFTNEQFKKHMLAKSKIKERRYSDAIDILLQILENKAEYEYNSYFMFSVYTDLDNCYKQICDFESAYKYSGKRISMLEGFSS